MSAKPKRTKKTIIVILSIILSLCLILLIGLVVYSGNALFFNIYASTYNAQIGAESVNDTQLTDNKLVKIGDRLYYNYCTPNVLSYGTYEISSNGTNRISWGIGPVIRDTDQTLEPIAVYGGALVSDSTSYDFDSVYLRGFNETLHSFSNEIKIDTSGTQCNGERFECIDGKNYFITSTHVYEESGGKLKDIVNIYDKTDNEILDYKILNIHNGVAYYAKEDGSGCIIGSYSIDSGKKEQLCTLPVECERITNIFSDGKRLITEVGYGYENVTSPDSYLRLYFTDTEKDNTPRVLYENNGHEAYGRCLLYDGILYYNITEVDGGIYALDLNDVSHTEKIYDGCVGSIHILDSKWIYFTDDKEALYRITHDGKTLEKVFG